MNIVKANREHIAEVSRLFDLYRQFYECPADLELATRFITERMDRQESDIFVAVEGDKAGGFVQLYASFCSVEAVKIYILYDLYVDAECRNQTRDRSPSATHLVASDPTTPFSLSK